MHLAGWNTSSGENDFVSGFWHHEQSSVHPLKKITVRMPGPSSKEFCLMSHMNGDAVSSFMVHSLTRATHALNSMRSMSSVCMSAFNSMKYAL